MRDQETQLVRGPFEIPAALNPNLNNQPSFETATSGQTDLKSPSDMTFVELDSAINEGLVRASDRLIPLIPFLVEMRERLHGQGRRTDLPDTPKKLTWQKWVKSKKKLLGSLSTVNRLLAENDPSTERCPGCGKVKGHAETCPRHEPPDPKILTVLESKFVDAALQQHDILRDHYTGRIDADTAIKQLQRCVPTHDRLEEYAECGSGKRRKETPEKDINVIAKEIIRQFESKPQAEKLKAVVEARQQLNPTIHQDLIRAGEARIKEQSLQLKTLKKAFKPLATKTGKALQRLERERRAKLDPQLEEKKKLAADFTHARVEEISYAEAQNAILRGEYLGSMPGGVTNCFGLFFNNELAAVEVFGSTAGSNVAASVCGPEHKDKVTTLVRGWTEPWAPKDAGSYLISRACEMMARKGKPITVAFSDPAGNELGQIYSAANFLYTGMTKGTECYYTPDGKKHNSRMIHALTRDRRNGQQKYKRTRAEQKQLLIEQGCKFDKDEPKHRWVLFSGAPLAKRHLRKALKFEVLPHPRRETQKKNTDLGSSFQEQQEPKTIKVQVVKETHEPQTMMVEVVNETVTIPLPTSDAAAAGD